MNDEKPKPRNVDFGHLFFEKSPDAPPAKDARKKRRRKGQLNDGKWAPGCGPDDPKNK